MRIFRTAMLAAVLGCVCSVLGQVERLNRIGVENAATAPAVNSPEWQGLAEQSTVLMRAQCRVFYRHVHVVETGHGRVAHCRTVWFVWVRQVFKGGVGIGDFVCFEEESETPTNLPVHTDDNHTPQPFCECILSAQRAELISPHNYMLRGVRLLDLPSPAAP
ncbi:MAG: hypothetical protein Q3986_01435 [Akkermansia sp.]|nr:hypothetical protein [Akkermansia sp.]